VGLHRFFSNGFISQENNSAEPGSLLILLCRPNGASMGYTAYNKDKAQVREYFGLDVDMETIQHYFNKNQFFIAQNVHKLKNIAGNLPIRDGTPTGLPIGSHNRGVQAITRDFDRYCNLMKAMFKAVKNISLKLVLALDGPIQSFLQKVNRLKRPDQVRSKLRGYFRRKAERMLYDLKDSVLLNIIVPLNLIKSSTREVEG
jgi:hypothetical protein